MLKLLVLSLVGYGLYLWFHRSKIHSHLPFIISIGLISAMLLFKVYFPILAFGIFLLFLGEYFIFKPPQKPAAKSQSPPPLSHSKRLTPEQARLLLNLAPSPSKEQINAAYYFQMKQHHPDRGGSKERAAQINAARELLLSLSHT